MVQKGALWPSSVISLGPHWHSNTAMWANFIHAALDVGT